VVFVATTAGGHVQLWRRLLTAAAARTARHRRRRKSGLGIGQRAVSFFAGNDLECWAGHGTVTTAATGLEDPAARPGSTTVRC
jgi:hypothetical protein